jgi:hypothetical protein
MESLHQLLSLIDQGFLDALGCMPRFTKSMHHLPIKGTLFCVRAFFFETVDLHFVSRRIGSGCSSPFSF